MHCFEIGLEVDVTEKERTSVSISWSVASGSILSSEVVWRVLTSSSESGESVNQGSSGSITSTKHTIEGLQHESVYNITVTVNTAGSGSFSQYVITFTGGLMLALLSLSNTVPECGSDVLFYVVLSILPTTMVLTIILLLQVIVCLRFINKKKEDSNAQLNRCIFFAIACVSL